VNVIDYVGFEIQRHRLERNQRNATRSVIAVEAMAMLCHAESRRAGWYRHPDGREKVRNVPEMLCLIHSEISEAMEGYRKGQMDKHLPDRPAIEVALADAMIRIFDLAGYLQLSLGTTILRKLTTNRRGADHKPEARAAAGGKAF
jgi:NTP pyrophosphatase (non-canonical NTP hydrolase)